MDRFKFRVWDIRRKLYITNGTIDMRNGIFATLGFEEAKKFIPEQCTGLRDKNGNLIYEGDILKNNFTTAMYEVVFRKAGFYFRLYFKRYNEIIDYLLPDEKLTSITEIIGNIHENPELLEDK